MTFIPAFNHRKQRHSKQVFQYQQQAMAAPLQEL